MTPPLAHLLRRAAERIAEDAEGLRRCHTYADGSFGDETEVRGWYFDDVLLVHALRRAAEEVTQL